MTDAPLTVIDDPHVALDEILEEKNEDNHTGIPDTLPEIENHNDEKIQNMDIMPEIEDNFESRSEKVSTPPEITEPEPTPNPTVESEPDRLVIEPEVPAAPEVTAEPGKYTYLPKDFSDFLTRTFLVFAQNSSASGQMKAKFVFMDAQAKMIGLQDAWTIKLYIPNSKLAFLAPIAAEDPGIRIQTPIRPTMKMKENTFVRTDYKTGNVGPKVRL